MQSFPDRLHAFWANLHSVLKFAIIVAVLSVIAFIAWRPVSGLYGSWQEGRNMKLAARALEEGDYAEARERAYQVLDFNPQAKTVYPVLLRAQDALADPRRTLVAQAIFADRDAKADDFHYAFGVMCRNAATRLAAASWYALGNEQKKDPKFVQPWLDRVMSEGLVGEAEQALALQPVPLAVGLERSQLDVLARKGDEPSYLDLQRRLVIRLKISPADGAELLPATDLVPNEFLTRELYSGALEWKEAAGAPKPADELRIARFRMAVEPSKATDIYQEFHARFAATEPVETARWCIAQGRDKEAIKLLLEPAKSGNADAYQMICEALYRQKMFDEWGKLLSVIAPGAPPFALDCDRAFLADRTGDFKEKSAAERRALDYATKDMSADDRLIRLATRAQNLELADLARTAWVEAIKKGTGPLPLSEFIAPLIQDLTRRKNEDELYGVLTTYCYLEPGNTPLLWQQLYLGGLRGQATPENIIGELTPLAAGAAGDSGIACTIALAELLADRPSTALAVTAGKDIDWFSASPGHRVIRALALLRTGNKDLAHVYLEGMDWETMLPSEKRVLKGLIDSAG